MLIRFLALAALLPLLTGCAASVSRTYAAPQTPPAACDIVITPDEAAVPAGSFPLGELRFKDSGFSTKCDEATALRLIRADGCSLDADVALITEEKSPNMLSTCYRADVTFYAVADSLAPAVATDVRRPETLAVNRGSASEQSGWAIAGYVVGFAIGYGLVALLTGG